MSPVKHPTVSLQLPCMDRHLHIPVGMQCASLHCCWDLTCVLPTPLTPHHALFHGWDAQEGPARIPLVSSHTPRALSSSTCQSPDREVSAVSNKGLKCSLCTDQCGPKHWGGEQPTGPWPWLGTWNTPDMDSHPQHLLWAQGRFRGYMHVYVHLFFSISSISGTGKGCDLLTVWEKVSTYSVWKGVVCSESISAHVCAHRRHHLGCWQRSPGASPWPWGVTRRPQQRNDFRPTMPFSSTLILPRRASAEFQWAGGVGTGSLLLTRLNPRAPQGWRWWGHFCQHSAETS